MNAQTKNEYMLIFRGNDWHKGLSPEEMQRVAGDWMAWFKRLMDQGKAVAGNPLAPEGKIVTGKNGRTVADGPFAESKEAIGGYFLLKVDSLNEAVAIARQCPGLPHGAKVEVRPVLAQCPLSGETVPETELAGTAA
ncbi:MAG: YciI family protein [Limisphaerales bacterium]